MGWVARFVVQIRNVDADGPSRNNDSKRIRLMEFMLGQPGR